MRDASVGFQCPECAAGPARRQRVARTAFGGRISPRQGVATITLVVVNVIVFVLSGDGSTGTLDRFGMFPPAVASGQYYRLLTAAFLHVSILHIAFNMYALWIVGPQLEMVFGRLRYLGLYFASAFGGTALSYLLSPVATLAVGASGAIFGLFGAMFVVARRQGINARPVLILIGLNLVLTFAVPHIDWRAHVGGLVAGTALAAAYAYLPRAWSFAQRAMVQAAATVGLAVVIVAVVASRTAQLTG